MKIRNSIIIFAILSSLVTSTYIYAEEEKVKSADVVNKLSDKLNDNEKEWLKDVLSKFEGGNQIYVGDFTAVIGKNNKDIDDTGRGIGVLGTNNIYNKIAYATIGLQNSNLGANAYVMGYQAITYAENSIAIGSLAKALPFIINGQTTQSPNSGNGLVGDGIAIGTHSIASGYSNALGLKAVAMGTGSVAIGTDAKVGSDDNIHGLDSFEKLQQKDPNMFGEYIADETSEVRDNKIGEKIFEKYKGAFTEKGITTFDQFKGKFKDNWKNYLVDLGIQMLYNPEGNGECATALGTKSYANVFGGVALGYRSVSKRNIILNRIAPYSNQELNSSNTYGAVSVGNDDMKRQIINVADATEDTDAVNLRQLREAAKFISFNNTGSVRENLSDDDSNINGDRAIGVWSTALGMWANAEGEHSISLGTSANAKGFYGLAIGSYSNASGDRGVAIGGERHLKV